MKTFREHLNEEVKLNALNSGGIDINRDDVRDEVNRILSTITSRSCVTPHIALNKMRKALAYFHIHLPKRTYMQGSHGVEVWEIHQFGEKMGFNDEGEWIESVPCKYYLFFHYHQMGPMYGVRAKIVDKDELDKEVDMAEMMVNEDAEQMKRLQRMVAPKEKMHSALGDCDCSQGDSPSTKSAINVMMRKDVKQIDEKAPLGAKFERMVKHIKAGYADDGLTKREKAIAYATAWKAKNKQDND